MASKRPPSYNSNMQSTSKFIIKLFGHPLVILSTFLCLSENNAFSASNRNKADLKPPYIVVIDPGHGGHDAGALTKLGKKKTIYEKDIALSLGLQIKRVLERPAFSRALDRKLKVILTRSKDKYISLEERSELAKKNAANLFLSIHMNSDKSAKVRGLEVYFLNNTDKESDSKLEQIENRHSHKDPASLLLRSIAADAIVESSKLAADTIHQSIVSNLETENLSFEDRGVRQAMLYVLLDSQVPAVLLEAFYLSNSQDLELLVQSETREKIAEGVAKGVLRFLATQ